MFKVRLFAFTMFVLCTASCATRNQSDAVRSEPPVVEQKATPGEQALAEDVSPGVGPAGIILYCRHRGEIHLLVANDRLGMRGWGGFMGGNKTGESRRQTAARETSEETRGYYKPGKLLRMIAGQQPVTQWGCAFYFAEVPYVPAKTIMDHPLERFRPAYMETQHYAWVPFSEIEPLLTTRDLSDADLKLNPRHLQRSSRSNTFWRVWIDNMRRIHRAGRFPWNR